MNGGYLGHTPLLIALLACSCTYAPANSGKTPASYESQAGFPPDQSAAQSIKDKATFIKVKLESCGSKKTSSHPGTRWKTASWTLGSTSGCVWRFEYSDEIYGYVSPREPSSRRKITIPSAASCAPAASPRRDTKSAWWTIKVKPCRKATWAKNTTKVSATART